MGLPYLDGHPASKGKRTRVLVQGNRVLHRGPLE